MTGIKKITGDGVWVSLGFMVNTASALVISIFLAQILTTEDVGVYFLVFSIIYVLSIALQLGMNITVVRFVSTAISKSPGSLRSLFWKMFSIVGALSLALLCFTLLGKRANLLIDLMPGNMGFYLVEIGLWSATFAIRSFLAETCRGFGCIKEAALLQRILPNIGMLVALLGILLLGLETTLSEILYTFVAVNTLLAVYGLISVMLKLNAVSGVSEVHTENIVSASISIWAGQLLQLIATQVPLWVLGVIANSESVAYYGVAIRLASVVSIPLLVVNNIIMPKVGPQWAAEDRPALQNTASHSVFAATLMSTPILIAIILMGNWLVTLLFGEAYIGAYGLLLVLSVGHMVNVVSGSPAVILAMCGFEGAVLKANIISLFLVGSLGVFVIHYFDAYGAAMATTLGLISINFYLAYSCYKNVGVKTYFQFSAVRLLR